MAYSRNFVLSLYGFCLTVVFIFGFLHNYYSTEYILKKNIFRPSKPYSLTFLQKNAEIKQLLALHKMEIIQLRSFLLEQTKNVNEKLDAVALRHLTVNIKSRVDFLINGLDEIASKTKTNQLDLVAEKLRVEVAKKFQQMQNPPKCDKVLQCVQDYYCGFGCVMRHLLVCMNLGIAANRTVVITPGSEKAMQSSLKEMASVFEPFSETCRDVSVEECKDHVWDGKNIFTIAGNKSKCIKVVMGIRPDAKLAFSTYSMPSKLYPAVSTFSSEPLAWWNGQTASFLMRPKELVRKMIVQAKSSLLKERPIVGIHIRRNDKFIIHPLDNYMQHVESWWRRYEQRQNQLGQNKTVVRKLYVATDDASVIQKLREMYPAYVIKYNKHSAEYAVFERRNSVVGLQGLVTDIHVLSSCDFAVCAYSSNVCRLTYHLMQSKFTDPFHRLHSFDSRYNPLWTEPLTRNLFTVVMPHSPRLSPNELTLNQGDRLVVFDIAQDSDAPPRKIAGYFAVMKIPFSKRGLVPSYKVKPVPRLSQFYFHTDHIKAR